MPEPEHRDRWWLVAAVGFAVFMAMLDMTVVNVALPTIERDFGTTTSVSEWVVLGYLLPLIALALPSGRWLDTVGQRAALTFSAGGFAAASVAVGLAPGMAFLIGARVVQGAFAAVLFSLTPVLATIAVRPQARGRAMGLVSTLGPLGGITGPVLGGFLIDSVGWPWIFYLNVPVSLAVIAIGLAQLPAGERLRLPPRGWLLETTLLATATATLMLALSLTASHGLRWLALAAAAVPPLLMWRRLETSHTVRRLVLTPGIAGPHLGLLSVAAAAALIMFILPFFMHGELGASPSVIGLTVLAFPLMLVVVGLTAGVIADRWGARPTSIGGAIVMAAGMLLLAPLSPDWSPADLAWRLAVVGVGSALFNTPNVALAMTNTPGHLLGTAGASTTLARQLGFAIGPAVATAIWAASGYAVGGMSVVTVLAAGLAVTAAAALLLFGRPASGSGDTERTLHEARS